MVSQDPLFRWRTPSPDSRGTPARRPHLCVLDFMQVHPWSFVSFFFFNKQYFYLFFLKILLFILFFREKKEREREGEKHRCVVASRTPHNLGLCPNGESNQQSFGSQAVTQPLSHDSQGFVSFFQGLCTSPGKEGHPAPEVSTGSKSPIPCCC